MSDHSGAILSDIPHQDMTIDKRSSAAGRIRMALGATLLTTMAAFALPTRFEPANIALLYLVPVMLVAMRYGRSAAIVNTVANVAAFDFFFVPPHFSFAISHWQYAITFVVMLAVGLVAGHLTAMLRHQARIAAHRESRSRALYEFARALSGALETKQIFDITRDFIHRTFQARTVLLLPDADGRIAHPPRTAAKDGVPNLSVLDVGIAQWVFEHSTPAGAGTSMLPSSSFFYMPLVAPMRTRGVLAIQPEDGEWALMPEQRKQLDTFAALAAIALERMHYVEVAQEAMVSMESERLRNSLLSALSHDLRTPLTSLVGLSESLALSSPPLAPPQREMADSLRDEAVRMTRLVANLLDMARIESGQVTLDLQWQPLEEVIGSARRASKACLAGYELGVELAPELPMVRFDAVLIERVLCNLVENAVKYTPPGARIVIAASVQEDVMQIEVRDNGPGIPEGSEEAIFEKFTRGERESAKPGVGLGLSICRAIVHAHGGTIRARNLPEGGASFIFSLPLGTPPSLPDIDELPSLPNDA
jgi:two-component system sensor histidine kinase KdpD